MLQIKSLMTIFFIIVINPMKILPSEAVDPAAVNEFRIREHHTSFSTLSDSNHEEFFKPLGNINIDHSKEIMELQKQIEELKKHEIKLKGLKFDHLSDHCILGLSALMIVVIAALIYGILELKQNKRFVEIKFMDQGQKI